MKAVFLRNLSGFTGHASLYKLDEEIGYGEKLTEPAVELIDIAEEALSDE